MPVCVVTRPLIYVCNVFNIWKAHLLAEASKAPWAMRMLMQRRLLAGALIVSNSYRNEVH